VRKYLVEFLGTALFVTAIFGAVLTGSALAPLGIGLALAAMVYAGGHISGAHYNPAVSVAVLVRGRLPLAEFVPYVVAQLLGALVAYLLSLGIFGDQLDKLPNGLDLSGVVLAAFLGELVFTFALAWVVLNVATSRDHPVNSFYGLAIGITVTAGAIAVGSISGAAFNPAVTLALTVAGVFQWKWIWLYLVAQLVGAALAGLAFRYVEPDGPRAPDEPEDELRKDGGPQRSRGHRH
jgi:glycerol uptake facilitator-like aquaporin